MASPPPDFNDNQKSALVQLILTGGLSLPQACALYGVSTEQVKDWVRLFRRAVRQALDHQLRDTLSLQGLELDDFARPEFSGNLSDIGVDDLLQTIQMGRKDGHITISHAGESSQIWCRNGDVIDAESGSLTGEAAFYRILQLENGNLVGDFAPNDRARRIALSTPALLLKAASGTGLRARLIQRLGDPDAIFSVATDASTSRAKLEPDERAVLRLFDGARSVEEIIMLSGLPDARAIEIVSRFRDQSLIDLHAPLAFEATPPSSNVAMSYRPFVAHATPDGPHLPAWLMACGAGLCSSLGAVAAIAYANAEHGSAPPPGAALAVSSAGVLPVAPPLEGSGSTLPASIVNGNGLGPRCSKQMRWLEGGEFTMGSDSNRPALSLARPARRITVGGFCLSAHEVTVAEYSACSDAGDCTPAHATAYFGAEVEQDGASKASATLRAALCNENKAERATHPINCVSHSQAASYCRALGTRLPSEAEWEFAARGKDSRAFPWGGAPPSRERLNACGKECERWHLERGLASEIHGLMYPTDDGYSGTAPVGSFPLGATPEGIEDLLGNVFEWTAAGVYDYATAPNVDPHGPARAESFVIRGGNFNSGISEFADPALRFAMHGESYSHGVGFRCAADAAAPGEPSSGLASSPPD